MAYPIEYSLIDYTGLYLPVQALRDLSVEHVLNIEGVWDAANIEVETNGLAKEEHYGLFEAAAYNHYIT